MSEHDPTTTRDSGTAPGTTEDKPEPGSQVSFRCPTLVHDGLRKVADRKRWSVSKTVLVACEELLEREEAESEGGHSE